MTRRFMRLKPRVPDCHRSDGTRALDRSPAYAYSRARDRGFGTHGLSAKNPAVWAGVLLLHLGIILTVGCSGDEADTPESASPAPAEVQPQHGGTLRNDVNSSQTVVGLTALVGVAGACISSSRAGCPQAPLLRSSGL